MPELRTDAQLVTAYTAGDRGALAGIYDRYSAGLYDTAAAMLRDRHEAADAMQDVFLIAAERMRQLREPERLKPWLYAILRNEVYRRSKKRGRALPTDFSAMGAPEMAAPIAPDAEGEALSAAELGELVRSAACGLDERDQLVLELSVRQGLQGADLAAALGVSAEQSYTLVHRMRERVDRSLGALVVARAGRKDCPELADVLRGWDGQFTVLVRKRVARHVENCERCERTRKKAAPIALMGAAPAFAAPLDLRDRVLQLAGTPGAAPRHAYTFDADGGFPRLLRRARSAAVVFGAAAAILLGIGGGAILASTTDDEPALATPTSVTAAPTTATDTSSAPTTATTTVLTSTTSSTSSTTSTSSTSTTSTTPSTTAPPGVLSMSSAVVDLGAFGNGATVTMRNTGGQPLNWAISGGLGPFALQSTSGTLQPGQSAPVTVSVNRSGLPEGDLERVLTVTGGSSPGLALVLRASVERAPALTLKTGPSSPLLVCQWQNPSVYVEYTDESAIAFPAIVEWTGPVSGSNQLKERGTTAVYGDMPFTPVAGQYTYEVIVTDVRGNPASLTGTFTVQPC
ncbi:MAG: sigma-70 family RNA polymerase sigma factor [Actinomycetota bacterium]|nr:sigma-70 family RNA polymerase sigma factor [Actinomycetota bacterium]